MKTRSSPATRGITSAAAVVLLGSVVTCVDQPTSYSPEITETPTASVVVPITHTLLTAGNNVTNQKIYTTASISPASNALVTVAVLGHNATAAAPPPAITGGGMSAWTQVASVTLDGLAAPLKRVTVYRAMSASPGSGPLTITFSSTQSNSQWIVSQWEGVDQSGANGAGAIGQIDSARADGVNGLAVALGAFGDANNVAYGVFAVRRNVAAITPGSGFTEIAEQPSAESTPADLQAEWATNDNTIDASWASLNGGALGFEIKAAGDGGSGPVVSPSQSTVTAAPASIATGSATSTITVTVKDAAGAPISGAVVVLSSTGSGNTLAQPVGPTNGSGVATGTIASTVAETKTISATANGTAITQTAAVEVTAPEPPGGGAITHTLLTAGNNVTNQKIYTTASVSPAPNALVTVAVLGHNATTAAPPPTVTGGGMSTWTQVASVTFDSVVNPLKRATIYRAMSASPGSGPITITFSTTQGNSQWIVSQWEGVNQSGTNGAGAIGQIDSARANAVSGLTVSLGGFADDANVAYGVFAVRRNVVSITPGSGFTEIAEQASGETAAADLQAEWATNDNTIDASWTNLNGAALGVEIKAGVGGGGPVVSPSQSTVAVAPGSIEAGTESSTITVTVKDAGGAPISGATVVLAATGSGNTLTQPAGPTNASGVATGTIASTTAESKTISATANGTAITQTATLNVTAAGPPHGGGITHTLLTAGNNVTNQKIYTTASISPAANALITVAVLGHNSSAAPPAPTLSGGGMSAWTQVSSVTLDPIGAPLKRLTIFRSMSASPGSGPLTITFSPTLSNSQWIVSQWEGVNQSGTNGSGAIGQTGSARADGVNGLSVGLNAFTNGGNVAYGVFAVKRNAIAVTPGGGFIEISEQPSGESTPADLQAEYTNDDNTINASWANLNGGGLGVEIKSAGDASTAPVVSVDVTPTSANLVVGNTVQLTATPQDAEGQPLTGRTITWSSSAPSIATVSGTGVVTGVAAGDATITATSEGRSGTSSISVTTTSVPVASVEVTPGLASVPVGGTVQLTATPKDASGEPIPGLSTTWATSAPAVATVSTSGLVTGLGEGPATITATVQGQSGTASVTVVTGGPALLGSWSSLQPAPIINLHLHLLPNGKILSWGKAGVAQHWDVATGAFTAVPAPSWLFCTGHDFLPDGRLLVTGGHISNSHGLPNTNIFDFNTMSWSEGPPMAAGRWYPTNTTLPNGEVLVLSGEDQSGSTALIPEIWNGSSWRQLTTASLALPNYPRMFVAPDGRLYYVGAERQTRWLDVTGTGSWTNGPLRQFGSRSYGSAVMYLPGKILYVGGNNPPTNTAEIIDLNQGNPQWSFTGSLARARWNLNATVLPTGDVLVTSGTGGNRSDPSLAVNTTELWNPGTGSWTTLASSAPLLRGYHSTTLLLPDGRLLHSGGGDGGGTVDNFNYEIYSPPYLFRGARPTISGSLPSNVAYGQSLSISTPDAASISKVSFIRLPSVTHAFDQAGRFIPLTFSKGSGNITASIPSSRNTAPPGPYMVFLVNSNGVPSVGQIVLLQ